jgi:hypothetical protein
LRRRQGVKYLSLKKEISKMENVQETPKDHVKIHGFFRVNIEGPDGKIVGDSGWQKNQVVNDGFLEYLCHTLGASAGSKQIGYVAIGTGSEPGATDTGLDGEILDGADPVRAAVTYANVGSTTAQFTATFSSGDSFMTAAANISNIGLFNATTSNATMFAGNTYASSSCDTNQNINITYQIRFS